MRTAGPAAPFLQQLHRFEPHAVRQHWRRWASARGVLIAAAVGCVGLSACVTSRLDPRTGHPLPHVAVDVVDPAGRKERNFELPPRQDGSRPAPASRAAGPDSRPSPDHGGGAIPVAGQGEPEESPYARFGSNIVVHRDKRITKFFYITRETGVVLLSMLAKPGAEPLKPGEPLTTWYTSFGGEGKKPEQLKGILPRLLDEYEIEIELIANWDRVASLDMAASFTGKYPPPAPGAAPMSPPDTGGPVNDVLIVTARAEGLEKFEQTLNLFYAQVPQVEIEARVVEFTYGETLDIGVTPIDKDTPVAGARKPDKAFIKGITSFFPNASTVEGLLTIGGVHDDIAINAVLELLQTKASSEVISKPRIAVRNSGMAQIETTSQVPFPEAKIIGTNVQTNIAFKTVGVKLHIRPVIAGTETVILNIFAEVSAVTSFVASDASTQSVPIPVISTRSANTSVHVPNEKTIIIGGLLTTSQFDNESKVPVLGDIPLLGFLFRSTSSQKTTNEIVFFITPRIIPGFKGERTEGPVLGGS